MTLAVWLEEFARAAAELQRAIDCVEHLTRLKGLSSGDFTVELVCRAEEYLERQWELRQAARAKLKKRILSTAERRRIARELNVASKRMRRIALYVQAQVFRLDQVGEAGKQGFPVASARAVFGDADGAHDGPPG